MKKVVMPRKSQEGIIEGAANPMEAAKRLYEVDGPADDEWAKIVMDQITGKTEAKGGEGSGNFDHAGRPGELGGSAPKGKRSKKVAYTPTKEEIQAWVKNRYGGVTGYHGTAIHAVESIKRQGILPSRKIGNRPEAVYYAENKQDLYRMIEKGIIKSDTSFDNDIFYGHTAIVKFVIPNDEAAKIFSDTWAFWDFGSRSAHGFSGTIKPEWIVGIEYMRDLREEAEGPNWTIEPESNENKESNGITGYTLICWDEGEVVNKDTLLNKGKKYCDSHDALVTPTDNDKCPVCGADLTNAPRMKDALSSGEYPRVSRVQDSGGETPLLTQNVYLYLQEDSPKHITIWESNKLPAGALAIARGSSVYINSKALANKPVSYVAAIVYQASIKTRQPATWPIKQRELDSVIQTLEWTSSVVEMPAAFTTFKLEACFHVLSQILRSCMSGCPGMANYPMTITDEP